MLDIFNEQFARAKGRVTDSSFISIRESVKKYHPIVRERILSSARSARPTSLVYKILSGLPLSTDLPTEVVSLNVKRHISFLSNSLRTTSPSSYGESFSGEIMNKGTESVILTSSRFKEDVWYNLEPIKFLYHTNTNLNFVLGSGDDTSIAFIEINVPMLVYQFLSWLKWKRSEAKNENVYNFIAQYPIYNSLKSYMDISLFNRFLLTLENKPIPDDSKHPDMSIPDITTMATKTIRILTKHLESKPTTIGNSLFHIPLIYKDNALDLVPTINVITTRQTTWFTTAVKLPYLRYGLLLDLNRKHSLDQKNLSTLQRELKALINTRIFSHVPEHTRVHIIDKELQPIIYMTEKLK